MSNPKEHEMRLFFALLTLAFSSPAVSQSFSCSYGSQPARLDYGDQVCSSSGMCVDRNAACFDTYQCNFEGFTCKSNVTECVEAHDDLLRTHNNLVDDFNQNLGLLKEMSSQLEEIENCLMFASTLEQAKFCAP